MASSVSTEIVRVHEEVLWGFIQNKEAWAPLIPGYLHHEIKTSDRMIWVFKGDFGIIEKAVKLQLNVKEIVENQKLSFDLEGLSDNINGSGYFEMEKEDDGQYKLTGELTMKAGGFLATMINPVLEKFVPQTVEALVKSMSQQVASATV